MKQEDYIGAVCIPLKRGSHALIDVDDFERVTALRWRVTPNGYALASNGLLMHRLVAGTPLGSFTDHINRDRLDNRRKNLRICTSTENARYCKGPSRGTSRYKGVQWCRKRVRWVARIKINGKVKDIGYFLSEHKAALAYNAAAKLYFGDFAYPNKVPKNFRRSSAIAAYKPRDCRKQRELATHASKEADHD